MRKFIGAIAGVMLALAAFHAGAEEKATVKEAESLVKKAIVYYDKNGKDKAFTEFSKMPGAFVDRDVYVTVYTPEGDCLAHINPKMVHKNMMELRDADGRYHIRERLDESKKKSSGWQDTKFFNPVTKKIEPKRIYWEKHDNLVFAAGAYKPE